MYKELRCNLCPAFKLMHVQHLKQVYTVYFNMNTQFFFCFTFLLRGFTFELIKRNYGKIIAIRDIHCKSKQSVKFFYESCSSSIFIDGLGNALFNEITVQTLSVRQTALKLGLQDVCAISTLTNCYNIMLYLFSQTRDSMYELVLGRMQNKSLTIAGAFYIKK